jgi:4'-phosphopantetheinyl transferase
LINAQETARASLERDGVALVFVDLAAVSCLLEDVERQTPRLSSADLERAAARAAHTNSDGLWRTARIALRIVLERYAGPGIRQLQFTIERGGRPRLSDGLPAFSHAHSGSAALIAVAMREPVGVDLEAERPLVMSGDRRARIEAAGQSLSPAAHLTGDDTSRGLQAWVRLEAVAKASGSGIGSTLTDAGVVGPRAGRTSPLSAATLEVRDLVVKAGYFAAVAAPALPRDLQIVSFPHDAAALHRFIA